MTIIDQLRSGIETQNWDKICKVYEQMSGESIHLAGENTKEKKRRGRPPKAEILFPKHNTGVKKAAKPAKKAKKAPKVVEDEDPPFVPTVSSSGDGEMQFITGPTEFDDVLIKTNKKIKKMRGPKEVRSAPPEFTCSKCNNRYGMGMLYKSNIGEGGRDNGHVCDNCGKKR